MILTLLSKIMGFFREIIMSSFYGTSALVDAYVIALTIPRLVLSFMVIAITTGYIPVYLEIREEEGNVAAERFTSNLFNILLLVAAVATLVGECIAVPIVNIIAPGFDAPTSELATFFVRGVLPILLIMPVPAVFSGFLNANKRFFATGVNGILLNVGLIAALLLGAYFSSPLLLIIITTLAYFFQYTSHAFAIRNSGFTYTRKIDWHEPHLRRMMITSLPLFFTIAINELNVIIDKNLASRVAVGSVATLNYASMPYNVVVALVITSIGTAVYPQMSEMAAQKKNDALRKIGEQAIVLSSALMIPIVVMFMLFPQEIIALIYERGAFTAEDSYAAGGALFFYAISLYSYAVRNVCVRALQSIKNTRTSFYISAFMIVINLVGSIALFRPMGINGLALATTISSIFGMIASLIYVIKRTGRLSWSYLGKNIAKMLVGSAVMGAAAKVIFAPIAGLVGSKWGLVLTGIAAILIYGVMVLLLKIDGVESPREMVHRLRIKRIKEQK